MTDNLTSAYPVQLDIDYPEQLNRLTTLLARFEAYAFLLTTDRYPPFSLGPK